MAAEIKAVVFRTPRLYATKEFFVQKLGLVIQEYSATHFVIHSKAIRLLFVEADHDLKIELYMRKKKSHSAENKLILHTARSDSRLSRCEDPNGIQIIITGPPDQ